MTKYSLTVHADSREELDALLARIYAETQDFTQVQQSPPWNTNGASGAASGTAQYGPATGQPLQQGTVATGATAAVPVQDPWANTNPTGGPVQGAPVQQQQATQTYAQPAQQQQGFPAPPSCNHGPMRFVQGGFSQRTNKPYAAFYGCQAQQGDPNKCRSVPA